MQRQSPLIGALSHDSMFCSLFRVPCRRHLHLKKPNFIWRLNNNNNSEVSCVETETPVNLCLTEHHGGSWQLPVSVRRDLSVLQLLCGHPGPAGGPVRGLQGGGPADGLLHAAQGAFHPQNHQQTQAAAQIRSLGRHVWWALGSISVIFMSAAQYIHLMNERVSGCVNVWRCDDVK